MSDSAGYFHGRTVIRFTRRVNVTVCSATRAMHHLGSGTSSGRLRIMYPAGIRTLLTRLPRYLTVTAANRGTAGRLVSRFPTPGPGVKRTAALRVNAHGLPLCQVPSASETCPLDVRGGTTCCCAVFRSLGVLPWSSLTACLPRGENPGGTFLRVFPSSPFFSSAGQLGL